MARSCAFSSTRAINRSSVSSHGIAGVLLLQVDRLRDPMQPSRCRSEYFRKAPPSMAHRWDSTAGITQASTGVGGRKVRRHRTAALQHLTSPTKRHRNRNDLVTARRVRPPLRSGAELPEMLTGAQELVLSRIIGGRKYVNH